LDAIQVGNQPSPGIIGAAVIDNDDLKGPVGLGKHAFDGVQDKADVVVRGDNDRNLVVLSSGGSGLKVT